MSASFSWHIRGRQLTFSRPLVMGIVNATPDSFSDGGQFFAAADAVEHAMRLADEGADLLDVGGESTRPGSQSVSVDDEIRRILPVVEEVGRRTEIPISIDTSKADVARQALGAGALIINDVTAFLGDPEMPTVARETGAGAILMHMRGTPATMQQSPEYPEGVLPALDRFFQSRLQDLPRLGIPAESLVLDPGIGFGKTGAHNWEILANLDKLMRFGRPVCLGVSRKGLFGKLLDRPVEQRLAASLAVACAAMARGAVQILRVHDVAATRDAVRVFERLGQV